MRAKPIAFLLFICWLVALQVSPQNVAQRQQGNRLRVTLEPVAAVFESPSEVVLRLTISGENAGCENLSLVDQFVSPGPASTRPYTVVILSIQDEAGNRIERERFVSDVAPLRAGPGGLVAVGCGYFFGYHIPVTKGNWAYKLERSGKYRVRARVEFRIRPFVEARPELRDKLAEVTHLSAEELLQLMPDEIHDTGETTFRVREGR